MNVREAVVRARRGRPSRAEQVATRRRALLDAAGVVFRRDGYAAATVDSIAEEAGLTKGAVYSHFASKADLFLTLLEERISRRAADHDEAAQQRSHKGSVIEFLKVALAATREDQRWHLALVEFRTVAARDPELNARYARSHEVAIAGVVRSLGALYDGTGVSPPLPLESLARVSLAMEAGGVLEAIVAGDTASEAEALALMAHLLGFPKLGAPRSEAR